MENNEIMNTETVEITEDVRDWRTGNGPDYRRRCSRWRSNSDAWRFAKRKIAEFKEKKQAQPKEIEVTGRVE